MTGEIYIATNKVNGKQYVGKTIKGFNKRLADHVSASKIPKQYFHRALHKYSKNGFEFEVLEFPQEKLSGMEIKYIKDLDCRAPKGYNCTSGGDGLTNPSQETLDKMSKTWFKKGECVGTPIQKGQRLSPGTEFKKGVPPKFTTFIEGHTPHNKGVKKRTNTGRTHFKKGHITWNTSLKGVQKAWNKGMSKVEMENYKHLRIAN